MIRMVSGGWNPSRMDRLGIFCLIVLSTAIAAGVARFRVLRDAARRDVDGIDGDIRKMQEVMKGRKHE